MHNTVSPDDLRAESGQYVPDLDVRERCVEAWTRLCLSGSVSEAVLLCGPPGAGKSTWLEQNRYSGVAYYDATLTHPATRSQLCRIARESRLHVTIVWLRTPLDVCLARNAEREGARRATDDRVRQMWHDLAAKPPCGGSGVTVVYV